MAEDFVLHFGDFILKYVLAAHSKEVQPLGVHARPENEFLLKLKMLFLRHLLQLRCNTHVVSELISGCGVDQELDLSGGTKGVPGGDVVDTVKELRLGMVLLPTASLMNHSCLPNAFFRYSRPFCII